MKLTLVALEGTEKQVKWVESIRWEMIASLEGRQGASVHEVERKQGKEKAAQWEQSLKDATQKVLDRYSSAKWWIEHRFSADDELERMIEDTADESLATQERREENKAHRMFVPRLIIFDMNGTLTNTPFLDKQPLHVLPHVQSILSRLPQKLKLSLVTNQGGVAFGYTTEEEVTREVAEIAKTLNIPYYAISFAHPSPKIGYEQYATSEQLARRKPQAGMLIEAMHFYDIDPQDTLMVGDSEEDEQAAKAAGVRFEWANEFFEKITKVIEQHEGNMHV